MVEQHYRWDFIGLSTDHKPTPEENEKVCNGSTFYCADTSKLYVFCDTEWYEKTGTGGGGGGTSNYNDLDNQPQINGVTLTGNKTTGDLAISFEELANLPFVLISEDTSMDIVNETYPGKILLVSEPIIFGLDDGDDGYIELTQGNMIILGEEYYDNFLICSYGYIQAMASSGHWKYEFVATTDWVEGSFQPILDSGRNIKTINNQSILGSGNLNIGLGQTAEGGLYAPVSMIPKLVDKNALLISNMSGLSVGDGALALLRGANVTVKSAPAGTTEYHVANTYLNRLRCVGLQYPGAVCIINEAAEPSADYSNILSCTINGSSFVPHTGADDPDNDIIITVDKSVNPDSTITQIRCYTAATKSSSFYAGQMVGGYNGLANVIIGQSAFTNSGNVVAMVAAQSYNTGNGNAIFGRYHNSRKNRWFISGTGHDNTNGRSEAGAVVGQYSDITSDTLFAVGNGTNQSSRANAFEVVDTNGGTAKVPYIESTLTGDVILTSPNNTKYKLTVDDAGNLSTTAV